MILDIKKIMLENLRIEYESSLDTPSKLESIGEKIKSIESAKTLYELGITPLEAIKLLESKGIQPVLTEADKVISSHPRDFSSKESLIGVHKTRYAPTNNIIITAQDGQFKFSETITLKGVTYTYYYPSARNTIHMAVNDEVASHMYGSWDDCKYAVLIPFTDIPNDKIAYAEPVDTFTQGNLDLSENSWILCPIDEVDIIKSQNPKVNVLGYKGDSVQGFSQPFLTQLGYRAEHVTADAWNAWEDPESTKQFLKLMKKEGIKTKMHSKTFYFEDYLVLTWINRAVELCKLIRDNRLISEQETLESLFCTSNVPFSQSFEAILNCLAMKTSCSPEDIPPESIVGNLRQVDIFIEKMHENGFEISPVYQMLLRRFCQILITDYNGLNYPTFSIKSRKDDEFILPDDASDEEKNIAQRLNTFLTENKHNVYCLVNDYKENVFNELIISLINDTFLHSLPKNIYPENNLSENCL